MSWNGDTETAAWRFYASTDKFGSRKFLGEVERKSFETSLLLADQKIESASAEAVDVHGRVLVSTGGARVEALVLPPGAKETQSEGKNSGFRFQRPLIKTGL